MDLRKSAFFILLDSIQKLLGRLKFNLIESRRYKIITNSTLRFGNNYQSTMMVHVQKAESTHVNELITSIQFDRRLFLNLCIYQLENLSSNQYRVLDVGGGYGVQAVFLKGVLGSRVDIAVIEQSEVVDSAKNISLDRKLDISFFKEEEFLHDPFWCHLIMFNGSLSYFEDPISYLEKISTSSRCQIIALSRVPVCRDINEPLLVFDQFGGHHEYIIPESSLLEWLNTKKVIVYEFDTLPRSKRLIGQFNILSANLICSTF